ncbi:nucleoside recognition protein, partial [bacterium]|nr:nucleoside recognition protein [bacterium]
MLKIILPISFLVSLMNYLGVIAIIATYLSPVFSVIGLPGESAIVFISSLFLTLYAPIAIMATLALDMREVTILALMCLISHNMFVETAIQKKTGSSAVVMFTLRLFTSFLAAFILNKLLPEHIGVNSISEKAIVFENFGAMVWA